MTVEASLAARDAVLAGLTRDRPPIAPLIGSYPLAPARIGSHRLIVDSPGTSWLLTTADGVITDCSPALLAWIGYSRAEVIGQPLSVLEADCPHTEGN